MLISRLSFLFWALLIIFAVKPIVLLAADGRARDGQIAAAGASVLVDGAEALDDPSAKKVGSLLSSATTAVPFLTFIPRPYGGAVGFALGTIGGFLGLSSGSNPLESVLQRGFMSLHAAMKTGFEQVNEKLDTVINLQQELLDMTSEIRSMVQDLWENQILHRDKIVEINNDFEQALELFLLQAESSQATGIRMRDLLKDMYSKHVGEIATNGALGTTNLRKVLVHFLKQSLERKEFTFCSAAAQVHWIVATRHQLFWLFTVDAMVKTFAGFEGNNTEQATLRIELMELEAKSLRNDLEGYLRVIDEFESDWLKLAISVNTTKCLDSEMGIECQQGEFDSELGKCNCPFPWQADPYRPNVASLDSGGTLVELLQDGYQGAMYRDCEWTPFSCDLPYQGKIYDTSFRTYLGDFCLSGGCDSSDPRHCREELYKYGQVWTIKSIGDGKITICGNYGCLTDVPGCDYVRLASNPAAWEEWEMLPASQSNGINLRGHTGRYLGWGYNFALMHNNPDFSGLVFVDPNWANWEEREQCGPKRDEVLPNIVIPTDEELLRAFNVTFPSGNENSTFRNGTGGATEAPTVIDEVTEAPTLTVAPTLSTEPTAAPSTSTNVGLIAGVAAGAACVQALGGFIWCKKRRSAQDSSARPEPVSLRKTPPVPPPSRNPDYEPTAPMEAPRY